MASAETQVTVHEMPSFGLYVSINTGTFYLLLLFYFMFLRFHLTPAYKEIVLGRCLDISAFKSFLPLKQLVFALHHDSTFHVVGIM